MLVTLVRIFIMLGAGISIAITSRILADHWMYGNKVINLSTLWTGGVMILTMIFLLLLTLGRVGYPPIYWRLMMEPVMVTLSVIAGVVRYREIKSRNKEKRPKQSPEEENLERFRHSTDELLTAQPQELNTLPPAHEEDDQDRHS